MHTIRMSQSKSSITKAPASASARPFLKWAGGKSQLLDVIEGNLPPDIRLIDGLRYVEPFLGSGAVFFRLAAVLPKIKSALLIDANRDLVLTFNVVKDDPDGLVSQLKTFELEFKAADEAGRRQYFETVREQFNLLRKKYKKIRASKELSAKRAAQFIFLNRTCFNGLFRVNSKGEFNVPLGRYPNPTICDEANIRSASVALQKAKIEFGDYSKCEDRISAKTFIYLDPPYKPISKTASFTAYGHKKFGDDEQERLAKFAKKIAARHKLRFMLSNSDPAALDPDNDLLDKLYLEKGFKIMRVKASRMINSKAEKRGKVSELLVTNY